MKENQTYNQDSRLFVVKGGERPRDSRQASTAGSINEQVWFLSLAAGKQSNRRSTHHTPHARSSAKPRPMTDPGSNPPPNSKQPTNNNTTPPNRLHSDMTYGYPTGHHPQPQNPSPSFIMHHNASTCTEGRAAARQSSSGIRRRSGRNWHRW